MALLLRDQTDVVLALNLSNLILVNGENFLLVLRNHDVVLGNRDAGQCCVTEAQILECVEHHRNRRCAVGLNQRVDDYDRVALADRLIDELVIVGVEALTESIGERALNPVVVDDPADCRQQMAAAGARRAVLSEVVEVDDPCLVQQLRLLGGAEYARTILALRPLVATKKLLLLS